MAINVGANKRAGIVLIIVGIFVLGVALLPKAAGLPREEYGWGTVIGVGAGILIAVFGVLLTRKKGNVSEPPL